MQHSVLIAAYQAAAFLPKALASLRVQTDADWELIVVEDGSRDATETLVRNFADTVAQPARYENMGINRGVAAVRSRLLELARSDTCSFLDADDWWEPGHLANARVASNGGADFIASDIFLYDIDANKSLGTADIPDSLTANPASTLLRNSVIMTSSGVTLRRAFAARIGAFDAALRIGEDRDYWLRYALAGARFARTRARTCTYSKHASSTMTRTLLWAAAETAFYEKYKDQTVIPRGEYRRAHARALQNEARLLRHEKPVVSARLLRHAFALTPANLALLPQWLYSGLLAARSGRVARNA